MFGRAQPRSLGHHALAVLAAVMVGATAFSTILATTFGMASGGRMLGLLTLAVACWLTVVIFTLPSAGLILTLLWPVTRRGTAAGNGIGILACATMGIILAPLANPKLLGATMLQLAVFAGAGAVIAVLNLVIVDRLGRAGQAARGSALSAL